MCEKVVTLPPRSFLNFKDAVKTINTSKTGQYQPSTCEPLLGRFMLSEEAYRFFTNADLIQFVLVHGFAVEKFGAALVHLCFNNYKLSKSVCRFLLRNIVNNDYDKIKDYLTIVG